MKKLNTLFGAFAVILSGSSVVNAATSNGPVSSTLNIHGLIISDTCTFDFPTSATKVNVDANDYLNTKENEQIGNSVSLGNISARGCNTKTVTLKAKSNAQIVGSAEKGTFTYNNKPTENPRNPLVFSVGYEGETKGLLKLDNSEPVSFSSKSDIFDIPIILKVMKQDNVDNINNYAGDFSATVTYTADFS